MNECGVRSLAKDWKACLPRCRVRPLCKDAVIINGARESELFFALGTNFYYFNQLAEYARTTLYILRELA